MPNGSTRHPDFLVTTPEGDEFYLEAVLASEFSADEIAAESRKNTVLNTIEGMESPNFYLGINTKGNPDTPPSGRRLREDLSRWLETLDPDTVKNEVDERGIDAIPTVNWNHENWDIQFEAFPKSPEKRGVGQRIIGSICSGVRWANIWEPIKNAIRAKGNRYGELDKPYLIAVNVDANSLDRIDEMQALFGQEEFLFNPNSENAQPEMRRIPNGAWYEIEGPQYTRVSGAWLFGNLNPWNIISRKNTLYFNPYALLELPDLVKQLNHAILSKIK